MGIDKTRRELLVSIAAGGSAVLSGGLARPEESHTVEHIQGQESPYQQNDADYISGYIVELTEKGQNQVQYIRLIAESNGEYEYIGERKPINKRQQNVYLSKNVEQKLVEHNKELCGIECIDANGNVVDLVSQR